MLSPRSCRTRSPGLSSSLPLASIPFFQGGFHTDTRSQGKPLPTDIRLRGIRLDVSVCGNDEEGEVNGRSSERRVPSPLGLSRVVTEEDEANRWSSERRVPSPLGLSRVATEEDEANRWSSERRVPSSLGLSRVATEEDEVNLFSHYFSESENIGLLWAKVRMFCIESTDVCLKEVRCF